MINYLLQVLLFQALFLAVYDFFLQKETFFNWNRAYLLVTPFLSFIIPLLKFDQIQQAVPQEYVVQLPTVLLNPEAVIIGTNTNDASIDYLSMIFYLGVLVFSVLFFARLYRIIKLIVSSEIIKQDIFSLVMLKTKQSAFSFFNYIFINKNLIENKDLDIIKHELVHCKQKHSIDLLIFEILKIILWFNPLIYVYQKRITVLHEYISDAEVVKETNKQSYFNSLLSETFNVENISFINQFYKQSLIKKRIAMITKNKSKKMNQLKYLLIVPLLVGMLIYSSCADDGQNKNQPQEIHEVPIENYESIQYQKEVRVNDDKGENKEVIQEVGMDVEIIDVPFAIIENVPVFPGCEGSEEELKKCIQKNISKHVNRKFNSNLATSLDLSPGLKQIFVMFKIDKNGNIAEAQARAPHQSLADEAIRVINSLPQMIPGKQRGKNVAVKYSLPITFKVASDGEKGVKSLTIPNTKFEVIKGTVTNEDGKGLPGANIIIKGTSNGLVTDYDGNFAIKALKEQILTISYIGFQTQEVKIGNEKTINIVLKK